MYRQSSKKSTSKFRSGEQEIQTSSHSSRSNIDIAHIKESFSKLRAPRDGGNAALKIVENSQSYDSPVSELKYLTMKKTRGPQVSEKIEKPRIEEAQSKGEPSWRKLIVTTGEFPSDY